MQSALMKPLILFAFLQPVEDPSTGAVSLEISRRRGRTFRDLLLDWINRDADSDLDERIFVGALKRRDLRELAAPIPKSLTERLRGLVRHGEGALIALSVASAALVAVLHTSIVDALESAWRWLGEPAALATIASVTTLLLAAGWGLHWRDLGGSARRLSGRVLRVVAKSALVVSPPLLQQKPNKVLTYAAIVIVAGVLATTLAQTQVLARLPLQNLLKNELHADRATNAAFFFWAGMAWYLKPLAGILTDAFPLFGTRRKSYILISSILAALSWLALIVTPHQYRALLIVVIMINTFMVIASTAVGGFMVETAQATSGSGRLTSIRQFIQQTCFVINGPISGYLASIAFGWTAAMCGGIIFLLVPVTILFLQEQRKPVDTGEVIPNAQSLLVNIATSRTMWGAAGLMALFYIAPGFSTALFYKQQNDLYFTTQTQGWLQLIAGVGGILAAVGYGILCRRLNLRTLLVCCMLIATAANLGYLFYSSLGHAQAIEGLNGFGYTLAELALMDLAVRSTPAGSEGLGFSIMISVRNLALFSTDWFGSNLLDTYHLSFSSLVIANSATTLIAVPLVFLLPQLIVVHKDAEFFEEKS
jgi:hypothetical protein